MTILSAAASGSKEDIELDEQGDNPDADSSKELTVDICHDPCPSSVKDAADKYWFAPNVIPKPLQERQRNLMICLCGFFSLFAMVALIIFLVWDIDKYQIYSRRDRAVLVEHVPDWIARGTTLTKSPLSKKN